LFVVSKKKSKFFKSKNNKIMSKIIECISILCVILVTSLVSCTKNTEDKEMEAQACRIKTMRLSYNVPSPIETYAYEYDSLNNLKSKTFTTYSQDPTLYIKNGNTIFITASASKLDSNNALFLNDKNKVYKYNASASPFTYHSYNNEGFLISTGRDNPLSQPPVSLPRHHNQYNTYSISSGNTIADTSHFKEGGSQYVFTSVKTYEFDKNRFNTIGDCNA
jgi:competence protein ComGC